MLAISSFYCRLNKILLQVTSLLPAYHKLFNEPKNVQRKIYVGAESSEFTESAQFIHNLL